MARIIFGIFCIAAFIVALFLTDQPGLTPDVIGACIAGAVTLLAVTIYDEIA